MFIFDWYKFSLCRSLHRLIMSTLIAFDDTQVSQDMEVELAASPAGNQPMLGGDDDGESLEDYVDDDVDDLGDCEVAELEGDEDAIRGRQKLNSVATLSTLRMQPISLTRFSIPLCRMLPMPMVRPTLQSDLIRLEQEFVHGYREGAAVFYVSTTNEDGKTQEVTEADRAAWGPLWDAKNDTFTAFLDSVPELRSLSKLMFFV